MVVHTRPVHARPVFFRVQQQCQLCFGYRCYLPTLTKTQCTGQAPLALHMDSLLAPPTESVPLEASCTTADGHWVRPQSTEAGQRLDRTHKALLSTAHLYFSSGSETPAGVSPQEGSSHLATCHSTLVTKAHVEEDPCAPKSKEGEGMGQFSSSL